MLRDLPPSTAGESARIVSLVISPDPEGPLPEDFAARLGELVSDGQEESVAGVLEAAVELGDEELAGFLDLLAARLLAQPDLLAGAEVAELLSTAAAPPPG